ncbi:MAG: hypothetical protein JRC93_13620 [Deltaproteobacteria bacterium]|nr:hypothetical protein [Deltaproteobacteria bacterium]
MRFSVEDMAPKDRYDVTVNGKNLMAFNVVSLAYGRCGLGFGFVDYYKRGPEGHPYIGCLKNRSYGIVTARKWGWVKITPWFREKED